MLLLNKEAYEKMLLYAVIAGLSVAAGIVQGVSGFGIGIVIMCLLPHFLPLPQAAGLAGMIAIVFTLSMSWRYRRHLSWKQVLLPSGFFLCGSGIAIVYLSNVRANQLNLVFGCFLVVLSIFFLLYSDKLYIRASLASMLICGFISGLCDGLFAIGGPLMVLYYISVTRSKEEYFADLQTSFAIAGLFALSLRVYEGIITSALLSAGAVGMVGVMIGMAIALKLVNYINHKQLRQLVYVMIGVSGFINIAKVLI